MKTAFLYAGQGAQATGMGRDLYEKYPVFKEVYDAADRIKPGLKDVIFLNKDDALTQTENTQPALVAFAIGVTKLLEAKNIFPETTLGLSLGEYSALYGAGAFSAESALRAAAYRGEAMKKAGEGGDWGMSAVLGLDPYKLERICSKSGCYPTNYNCPGQIVISGEKDKVAAAGAAAKEAGARRVIPLKVSGPFHTPYMKSAGDALSEYLPKADIRPLRCRVLFNATGDDGGVKLLCDEHKKITDLLVRQVQNPVRLEDSLDTLLKEGCDDFIEIGPGKTLSGFVKKCAKALDIKDISIRTINTAYDIENL
ncbi:MAG: ACP S-malonyltransferase [Lachnospiraceae bacterium]|uniref:Malonyl CoA-acyl carrier protein transacylase n=1 Tax=Candidatus Weimeria bifida TaxID=2599074 RepID=A0A6N7J1F6_9FIRM|nr:ACP S-malonyltransferase [Candidatus Weimeria bifida]RRF96540.1 MAG: ACP S-malonyltransferase [Lachnospiraceae bacterium]